MNEQVILWLLFILIIVWKLVTTHPNVQKALHSYGDIPAFLLQWYTLAYIGLTVLYVRTIYDFVLFDYGKYTFLSHGAYVKNIEAIAHAENWSDQKAHDAQWNERDSDMCLPSFLRWTCLIAPWLGLLGYYKVSTQLYHIAHSGMQEAEQEHEDTRWHLDSRYYMKMLIVFMPAVFIVMALRAMIRVLAVVTGSGFHVGSDWDAIVSGEKAEYTMDLEMAATFQYYAVLCFGLLTAQILAKNAEDKFVMTTAGLLGLIGFVVVGSLRSIMNIAFAAIGLAHNKNIDALHKTILDKLGPVFMFATVLCVLNMQILGKTKQVEAVEPGTNNKFMATRILLIIGQVQLSVLMAVCNDSPSFKQLETASGKDLRETALQWSFNSNEAMLLHACLLSLEAMAVALYNARVWPVEFKGETRLKQEWNNKKKAVKDLVVAKLSTGSSGGKEGYIPVAP